MALDPLTAVFEVGKTVLERVLPQKMNEEERATIANNFTVEMFKIAATQDSDFRKFILQYEGEAKDLHPLVNAFRSLIRPLFTIAVAYWDWLYFTTTASSMDPERLALLKTINLIVLFFWFGERAVTNSGILDVLRKK